MTGSLSAWEFPKIQLDKAEVRECEYCGSDFTTDFAPKKLCDSCVGIWKKRQEVFEKTTRKK